MKRISPAGTMVLLFVAAAGIAAFFVWRQVKDDRPVLRVYCGGSMRRPMEELIRRFEAANHVRVDTSYNGCGVLVGQMKSGAGGDVYYACDATFMDDARSFGAIDESYPVVTLTHFRPVIMVKKHNPRGIRAVGDLARPGLKIGIGGEDQGAVGRTAWRIIRASPQFQQIKANIKTESSTADILATQLLGELDAVIIWDVVARNYDSHADAVPIPDIQIDQPIALMKKSSNPDLARRFIEFVRSDEGRRVFAQHGFTVHGPATQP